MATPYLPKRAVIAIIEQAHTEGIGPRRLERLLPMSFRNIARIREQMQLPPLSRSKIAVAPSVRLLEMICCICPQGERTRSVIE